MQCNYHFCLISSDRWSSEHEKCVDNWQRSPTGRLWNSLIEIAEMHRMRNLRRGLHTQINRDMSAVTFIIFSNYFFRWSRFLNNFFNAIDTAKTNHKSSAFKWFTQGTVNNFARNFVLVNISSHISLSIPLQSSRIFPCLELWLARFCFTHRFLIMWSQTHFMSNPIETQRATEMKNVRERECVFNFVSGLKSLEALDTFVVWGRYRLWRHF